MPSPILAGLIVAGLGSAAFTYLSRPPAVGLPLSPAMPLPTGPQIGDVVRVPFASIPDSAIRARLSEMTPASTTNLVVGFRVDSVNADGSTTGPAVTWSTFQTGTYPAGPVTTVPPNVVYDVWRNGHQVLVGPLGKAIP